MNTKNSIIFKYIILSVIVFSIFSCEKDFENIGDGLISNEIYNTNKLEFEVLTYNQNLTKSQTEGIPLNGIGILNSNTFGKLTGEVASQVNLPITAIDFGENPTIDKVVFEVPYDSEIDTDYDDGKPQFILNNIYGNPDIEFELKIHELGTYMNRYDETDPTKLKKYYSDKVYDKLTQLFSGNFKPNKNDTVYYVRRPDFDELDDNGVVIENFDTIKQEDSSPVIHLDLDKNFFETKFVNNTNDEVFNYIDKFQLFFKGIYIESIGNDGAYLPLDLNKANIIIYFSSDVLTDEDYEDLNGDGDTNDLQIPVRTKQQISFPLANTLKASVYKRDYSTATSDIQNLLDNPNTIDGESKLYLQGNAGNMIIMDAFQNIDLDQFRNSNQLIVEANLNFYVNTDVTSNNVPDRIFLCKLDENPVNGVYENTQVLDILTEGEVVYDGNLEAEIINEDTTDEEIIPIKYQFRITDYMSEVLKKEDPENPSRFAIKVFHSTDLPNTADVSDTIVRNYSWDQKGVVLFGNNIQSTDVNYDKRIKLDIFYSELNN